MITRLPGWVWWGGGLLAANAGVINAVSLLSFGRTGASHLTGSTTLLGISVAGADYQRGLTLAAVIAAFVAGAILSGFIIQDHVLRLGRRYGVALLMESALLFAAAVLSRDLRLAAELCASAACGLQNAMASTYSGAVFRTTHVTGTFTDLGIYIGHWLRGVQQDRRRLYLGLLLTTTFAGGAVIGAALFATLRDATLLLPAVLTGSTGMVYSVYAIYRRRADLTRPPR